MGPGLLLSVFVPHGASSHEYNEDPGYQEVYKHRTLYARPAVRVSVISGEVINYKMAKILPSAK